MVSRAEAAASALEARRARAHSWLVAAATLTTLAIYGAYAGLVAFLPFGVHRRRLYLFDVLGFDRAGLIIYVGGVALLFASAIAVWHAVRLLPENRFPPLWAIAPPLLFAILLTVTLPLNSRDLFHYIMEGRVLGKYGGNPFLIAPAAFPNDALTQFSNWKSYPSPYGPLWVLLAAGLTTLAGNNLFWSVVAFKLVGLASYSATGVFIWRARRASAKPALAATVLWLWHPLILIELVGNGHNDALMLAFLAGGFYFQVTGRLRAALLAVAVAALVKYAALPFLPLLLWHQARALPDWKSRLRGAVRNGWPVVLVAAVSLVPFWVGARTLGFLRESEQFYASLPHLLRTGLRTLLPGGGATMAVRLLTASLLSGGYAVLLARTTASWDSFLRNAFWLTVLLLVTWSFFVPWYVAWLVFVAAMSGAARYGWQVFWFGLAAELSYVVQFYLPAKRTIALEHRSAISALVVFTPLLLALLPWSTLWRKGRIRLRRVASGAL